MQLKLCKVADFIKKYGYERDGTFAIAFDKAFQCASQPNINFELQKQGQQKFNEEMRIVFENKDLLKTFLVNNLNSNVKNKLILTEF